MRSFRILVWLVGSCGWGSWGSQGLLLKSHPQIHPTKGGSFFVPRPTGGKSAADPPEGRGRSQLSRRHPWPIWLSSSSSWDGRSLDDGARWVRSLTMGAAVVATLALAGNPTWAAETEDRGASISANAKIRTGGASTLQSGRTITITRGVNLDGADFAGQNLAGVAFQQSIVREANFRGANLRGASFFDATVDGSDFGGADLTLANVEMAQFNRANLHDAILQEMYVSGATIWTGVKDIEGSDWTDTYLRADQRKYLCSHPTAKGTNPITGMDTRQSLQCPD